MRSTKAIFIKQAKDIFRNPMILIEFIIFPAVALIMTELIAKTNDAIPPNMFVTMMASIFTGMALIPTMAGIIAEDTERQSLRFLVMAGVKPHQYLLGAGGFVLLAGIIGSGVFTLIGSFTAEEALKFLTVMILSAAASIILGAAVGILSKNQQSAMAASMPLAVIFGFTPMIASFNETIEKAASVLYTQQMNVIVNDFSANFPLAIAVIAANIAVFSVVFAVAYRKKWMRTSAR